MRPEGVQPFEGRESSWRSYYLASGVAVFAACLMAIVVVAMARTPTIAVVFGALTFLCGAYAFIGFLIGRWVRRHPGEPLDLNRVKLR